MGYVFILARMFISYISVELPPVKTENGNSKVFTFDQFDEKEKGEKEQETRLNIEVRLMKKNITDYPIFCFNFERFCRYQKNYSFDLELNKPKSEKNSILLTLNFYGGYQKNIKVYASLGENIHK